MPVIRCQVVERPVTLEGRRRARRRWAASEQPRDGEQRQQLHCLASPMWPPTALVFHFEGHMIMWRVGCIIDLLLLFIDHIDTDEMRLHLCKLLSG